MAHPKGRTGWMHLDHKTQREFERVGFQIELTNNAIDSIASILGVSPDDLKNGSDGDKGENGEGLWALTVFIENRHLTNPKVVQGLNFDNRIAKPSDPDLPLAWFPIKFGGKNTPLEKKYRTFDEAEKSNIDAWGSVPLWDLLKIEGPISVEVVTDIIDLKQFGMKGESVRNTVQFVNDELAPGPFHYYGTDERIDSVKGWYPLSLMCGRLEIDFDHTDLTTGSSKLIGAIPPNTRVFKAVVIIHNVFDNNAEITLGDSGGAGKLATVIDTDLEVDTSYDIELEVKYTTETELYLYQASGLPTTGNGTVIIYYSGG